VKQIDSVEAEARGITPPAEVSRRAFVAGSVVAGFTLATGPVHAQTVITTDAAGLNAGEVKVPVSDGQLPAYRAMPSSSGPFPTVLVVQEIFGVHERIKDVCRRFAKAGYLAIAPELFARHADMSKVTSIDEARAAAGKVSDQQVMSDIDAVTQWAKGQRGETAKLGITGFCYGGRVTWLYAAHSPMLKAGVAWYGVLNAVTSPQRPKHPLDLVADLKAPVLGLYGSADQGIPVPDVEEMRDALRKSGKSGEIVLYDGAPHGFHADYRASYRAEPAKDGWQRCLAWFRRYGVA
jgi:carboxymethylenebutenolidase